MRRLRACLFRLAAIFPNSRREDDLAKEFESHLEMHIADNLRRGMTPEEARRDALIQSGGIEPAKESYRDRRSVPFIENLARDLRFSIRQLRQNPGFTATAVAMLALGICASVAIFAFVDAALIKPLPYKDPARLVGVFESIPVCPQCNLSYPDYLDWKRMNRVFRSLDIYQAVRFTLTTSSGAAPGPGARVSDGFFRTLGVAPVLGRDFRPGEDLPAAPRTALISYAAWQQRYGGRADVLGKTVTLDGDVNTIIGVLPREFHFSPAEPAEFWTAFHPAGSCDLRRSCHGIWGVARLADGVSIQTALANVTSIAKQLEKQYPENRDQGAALASLSDVIVGNIRPVLLLLLVGAVLLLWISSINVASLLLVRAESRKREMAVRSALGASAARLFSQFVTEGLVLVAAGSALGVAAAYAVIGALSKLIPADAFAKMSYLHELGLNPRVWAFAGITSLLAAVLFSLTPAVHLSFSGLRTGLSEGSRGSSGNTWRRLGAKLVILELATAVVLLVGAGLLTKSFYRLLRVNIGIEAGHLATLQVMVPRATYPNDAQTLALARQMINRIENLPGVKSVSIATDIPITHWGDTTWLRVAGRPWHGEHDDTPFREVSAKYFTTLGAKLLRGRYFTDAEDNSKPRVALINRAFAEQRFPGEDPIGKQLLRVSLPSQPVQIIGIVDDIKEGPLDSTSRPTMYVPFNQNPGHFYYLVVRTSQAEQSLLPTLAASIRQIDPDIVTSAAATMSGIIHDSQSAYLHRSSAWLVGSFAALALLLGVIGLYGVVAYSVSQRTREIGVRMALGAEPGSVYRLVLREAGQLTVVGVAVGLVISLAAGRLMRGLLFGVHSSDVATLAIVTAVLSGAAVLASFIPARRAASVNPVDALRME